MAFEVKLSYLGQFIASEVADATTSPAAASNGSTRVFDGGGGMNGNYTGSGTPALSGRVIDISRTMAATDEDIDLTAAPLGADITKTVDLTGKKLIGYMLKAAAANGGNIVVKPHPTTNAYQAFITTDQGRTLEPGRHMQSMPAVGSVAGAAAVDGTHKVIRVSGAVGYVLTGILIFA